VKRYCLHPGFVRSRSDGDRHFITAHKLARCYGVPLRECVVAGDSPRMDLNVNRLIDLYPRSDGEYSLPTEGTA
jgi:hypothetical protein